MKNSFSLKVIFSLIICFLCYGCTQESPVESLSDEALIKQVMDKELTAFIYGETSSFGKIYADDAVLTLTANTADPSDDYIATGINSILNAYEAYHMKHSNIQQPVSITDLVITGDSATLIKSGTLTATFVTSGVETTAVITPDIWEFEKRDGFWVITKGWWDVARWF